MCVFVSRGNHAWYLIQSPRLPPAALQSPTPAPCLWTTPPSPTLHYRRPQVRPQTWTYCTLLLMGVPVWDVRCICHAVTNTSQFNIYSCFPLLVCVYLNKYGKVGPHLDQRRIQQLPDHFGPGRASSVLQQCVQACVDSAHNQGTVFSCLKSGQGGEVISGGDQALVIKKEYD